MKSIVFICNSTESEGLGHFIRCFNIATGINYLNPKVNIYFDGSFCNFAISKIKNHNFRLIKEKERFSIFNQSILIFDSYLHDQKKINEFTSRGLISIKIDDFNKYNLSEVDCVINFRLGAENEVYNSKKSLLGLQYFPFPIDLINVRKKNLNKLKKKTITKKNILIFIGGDDRFGISKKILIELDHLLCKKTFFWIDRKHNNEKIVLKNNILKRFDLQKNISQILEEIDCVICGGGLIKYDCGFSLIPCGSISQTLEQEIDSKICSSKNLIYNFGMYENIYKPNFSYSLKKFFEDPNLLLIRENMFKNYVSDSTIKLAKEIIKYCI